MLIYDRAPQGRSGEALGLRHAVNVCRARPAVVVSGADPAELARDLAGWRRSLVVDSAAGLSTVDPADAVTRRWTEPGAIGRVDVSAERPRAAAVGSA